MENGMGMLRGIIFLMVIFSASTSCADQNQETAGKGEDFRNNIYLKLVAGNYVDLERTYAALLESYLHGKITEKDISQKYEIFYEASGLESSFDEWVKIYPKSYSARLARAMYRITDAWERRGGNFADETTDEQFKGFDDGLNQATADLTASLKLYSRPILSYSALIKVTMGIRSDSATRLARRMLDEALNIDPQAYLPRFAYQYSLTPKWGGSVRLMEEFLQECKKSSMSIKDKKRIESKHHLYLGERARRGKNYRQASEHFLTAYQYNRDPYSLFRSGQSALDGSLYDLAFQQFNALVIAHPKYPYGYNKRGWIYESHFKNDEKSFNDYLVAADLGNSYAQNRVGWWYMTGKYVAKDYNRAEEYFRRAADQRNKNAIANLKNLHKLRKETDSPK